MDTKNPVTIVECGCDWLTLTATDDEHELTQLQVLFDLTAAAFHLQGHTFKPQKRLGYSGSESNGLFLGSSPQGKMLQASGPAAARTLRTLKEWNHIPHITRIDWQVTVHMGNDLVNYAELAAMESETERARLPQALRWNLVHYRGYGKGDSAYIGARTSQVCCRVYDKAAESHGEYQAGTWRYEVEYKGKVARDSIRDYIQSEEQIDYCLDIVTGEFMKRGVIPEFKDMAAPRTTQAKRPETSNEKRLRWLREAVLPAVNELRKAGLLQDALQALDLR